MRCNKTRDLPIAGSNSVLMVGVTGLEPATSRPPAVRATNCATPRNLRSWETDMISLIETRWVSSRNNHGCCKCWIPKSSNYSVNHMVGLLPAVLIIPPTTGSAKQKCNNRVFKVTQNRCDKLKQEEEDD